jgi:hypothetical protein
MVYALTHKYIKNTKGKQVAIRDFSGLVGMIFKSYWYTKNQPYMKTSILKLMLIRFIFLTLFVSCSKKEDVIDRNTELLVQKSWKIEMYGLDENNSGIIEESENGMLACEADDKYTFFPNGGGFYDGGTMPCSVGETPVTNFTWRFENNGTELAIFAAPEKINQLDENILEVYYMDVNSMGEPVKFIRRFQH